MPGSGRFQVGQAVKYSNIDSHERTSALLQNPGEPSGEPMTPDSGRHQATQPFRESLNPMSGYIQHHEKILRKWLLSSRSRVRVAVGAHIQIARSAGLSPAIGPTLTMPSGAAVPAACPIASSWP